MASIKQELPRSTYKSETRYLPLRMRLVQKAPTTTPRPSSYPPTSRLLVQCTLSFTTPIERQLEVVRWLLENGVDRGKPCYYGQTPLDVVGQCRLDTEAASDIRQALTEELKSESGKVH